MYNFVYQQRSIIYQIMSQQDSEGFKALVDVIFNEVISHHGFVTRSSGKCSIVFGTELSLVHSYQTAQKFFPTEMSLKEIYDVFSSEENVRAFVRKEIDKPEIRSAVARVARQKEALWVFYLHDVSTMSKCAPRTVVPISHIQYDPDIYGL